MTKVTKLKNGLTIITEPKKASKVCIGVLVKAGLINETDEQNGISHFLEHMAFKGTATKTAKELSESIEQLGGSCNAYTSTDHTFYHVDLLAEHWKTGLNFLNDIVMNSTFPKEEMEKERNVILQEIARSKDNPMHVFWDRLGATIYAKQRLGRTILGPAKNVKRFTKADLQKYVAEYYHPNNMIISVCGGIKPRKVVKYIKKLFGEYKPKKVKETIKAEFIPQSKVFEEIFDQAVVAITYNGPTKKDTQYNEAGCIFDYVLDGGMSCRLFQEMREKHGLCYSTATISDTLKDSGFIGIYAGVKEKDAKKALNVMEQVINSMKTEISDEEMEKAKNLALYRYANASESCDKLMSWHAVNYMYNGKPMDIKKKLKRLKKVTKEQVFDFANRYITNDVSRITLIHKKGK